jgi:hypothetical protein
MLNIREESAVNLNGTAPLARSIGSELQFFFGAYRAPPFFDPRVG